MCCTHWRTRLITRPLRQLKTNTAFKVLCLQISAKSTCSLREQVPHLLLLPHHALSPTSSAQALLSSLLPVPHTSQLRTSHLMGPCLPKSICPSSKSAPELLQPTLLSAGPGCLELPAPHPTHQVEAAQAFTQALPGQPVPGSLPNQVTPVPGALFPELASTPCSPVSCL